MKLNVLLYIRGTGGSERKQWIGKPHVVSIPSPNEGKEIDFNTCYTGSITSTIFISKSKIFKNINKNKLIFTPFIPEVSQINITKFNQLLY